MTKNQAAIIAYEARTLLCCRMTQDKRSSEGWRVDQRVRREDSKELGTIVEADHKIKVQWDDGRTSYFERDKTSNVKLEEDKT